MKSKKPGTRSLWYSYLGVSLVSSDHFSFGAKCQCPLQSATAHRSTQFGVKMWWWKHNLFGNQSFLLQIDVKYAVQGWKVTTFCSLEKATWSKVQKSNHGRSGFMALSWIAVHELEVPLDPEVLAVSKDAKVEITHAGWLQRAALSLCNRGLQKNARSQKPSTTSV